VHAVNAASKATGGSASPSGNVLGGGNNVYGRTGGDTTLHPGTLQNVGGSQPHLNDQPFLTINFCIALQGIFPSPT
jgi:microcystin-dependent protein